MRKSLLLIGTASLGASGPALACDLDGNFGFHRFNPLAAMQASADPAMFAEAAPIRHSPPPAAQPQRETPADADAANGVDAADQSGSSPAAKRPARS